MSYHLDSVYRFIKLPQDATTLKNKNDIDFVVKTNAKKHWDIDQYYNGEKNEKGERSGNGENHWVSADHLDTYSGSWFMDAMHGLGEYRWRCNEYKGAPYATYEGMFYNNSMNGYGELSYTNGSRYKGSFKKNCRFGPGAETVPELRSDVGFWFGDQIIRLGWSPGECPIPDLSESQTAEPYIAKHRTKLECVLLEFGGLRRFFPSSEESQMSLENYKNENMSNIDIKKKKFDKAFFGDFVKTLEFYSIATDSINKLASNEKSDQNSLSDSTINIANQMNIKEIYYSWNNSSDMIAIMKHCFQYEDFRKHGKTNIKNLLEGKRHLFRQPNNYELNCRSLLLAAYNGRTDVLTALINNNNINPNVCDAKGNSALMYAACGLNTEDVITFLFVAGADINKPNDTCTTPLAMAIIKYLGEMSDLAEMSEYEAACLPLRKCEKTDGFYVSDFVMNRYLRESNVNFKSSRLSRKSALFLTSKIINIVPNEEETPRKKSSRSPTDEHIYYELLSKFKLNVEENAPIKYNHEKNEGFFSILNVVSSAKTFEIKSAQDKRGRHNSIVTKHSGVSNAEGKKRTRLNHIESIILHLLTLGADTKSSVYPVPILPMALFTLSEPIVGKVLDSGANVNETYCELYQNTPLSIAMTLPPSENMLSITKKLLLAGANPNERIEPYIGNIKSKGLKKSIQTQLSGPTILHVAVMRRPTAEADKKIHLVEMLLNHGAKPDNQYLDKGVIEYVMNMNPNLLEVFVRHPKVDNNAAINPDGETMLAKLFNSDFFVMKPPVVWNAMLSSLLNYGVDPLAELRIMDEYYENIFVYLKNKYEGTPESLTPSNIEPNSGESKLVKTKKIQSDRSRDMLNKSIDAINDIAEYARNLHARWIRGYLFRELFGVVYRFKHRHWNMVLKEHKHQRACAIWLNTDTAIDMYRNIFKKKCEMEGNVLRIMLSLLHYYQMNKYLSPKLKYFEKELIDADVSVMLEDSKRSPNQNRTHYIIPELEKNVEKYNICFECSEPIKKVSIDCNICHMVKYCNNFCQEMGNERILLHPCLQYSNHAYKEMCGLIYKLS